MPSACPWQRDSLKRTWHKDYFSFKEVTLLAIATSIDAFAVGITIALINDPILISSVIIGIVAFIFSIAGIFIGKKLGDYVGDKFQILGGVILILIGIKILLGFWFCCWYLAFLRKPYVFTITYRVSCWDLWLLKIVIFIKFWNLTTPIKINKFY